MSRRGVAVRASQALALAAGATAALGEGSDRYDAARRGMYATHRLRERLRARGSEQDATTGDGGGDAPVATAATADAGGRAGASWLQREKPTFPYVLAMSPADNSAVVAWAVLGATDHIIGSPTDATDATLAALVSPVTPADAIVHAVAMRWRALKSLLHAEIPQEFHPQQDTRQQQQQLDVLLAVLRASVHDGDGENGLGDVGDRTTTTVTTVNDAGDEPFVFYLRDFSAWDDATTTRWLQWVHAVTSAGLAHVVLPTTGAVTPAAIRTLQRLHKVADADFVAILLRVATGASDQRSAVQKLRVLSQQYALDLRGLTDEEDHESGGQDSSEDEAFEPALPTEVSAIVESVGNWWSDLDSVCRELESRGIAGLERTDERLALVHEVCAAYEQEVALHVADVLAIHHDDDPQRDSGETREQRISALQAWKCLEVVTQVGDNATVLASPQKLLQRDTDKPLNCAHPVEALLPFNQRAHGEAKFMELIDERVLCLRPKNDVEIGVLPCDATALVAPCWVEARPVVKRAFEKLWRDDAHYLKILELERFEDNHKLSEEVALFEEEIDERRRGLDKKTREFIVMRSVMKKSDVAQRQAELALLELEIESKNVYLERLRALLD